MHPDECPHWDYEDPNPDCSCREDNGTHWEDYDDLPGIPDPLDGDTALDDQEES